MIYASNICVVSDISSLLYEGGAGNTPRDPMTVSLNESYSKEQYV